MKKLFVSVFGFAAISLFGALPPLAQSTRELQALLDDPNLYQKLGSSEAIKNITRSEHGFLVLTNHKAMQVDVQYIKEQRFIGPIQFELKFYDPIDLGAVEQ